MSKVNVEEYSYLDGIENYSSNYDLNKCRSIRFFNFNDSDYRVGRKLSFSDDVSKNTTELVCRIQDGVSDYEMDLMKGAVALDNIGLINKKIEKCLPEKYVSGVIDVDDVFQEVLLEYIKLIDKYDRSKGYSFNTYAAGKLGERASDYIAQNSTICKMSPHTRRNIMIVGKDYEELVQDGNFGWDEFVEIECKKLKIKKENKIKDYYNDYIEGKAHYMSLDEMVENDGGDDYEVDGDYEVDVRFDEEILYEYNPERIYERREIERREEEIGEEVEYDLEKYKRLKGKEKSKFKKELMKKYNDLCPGGNPGQRKKMDSQPVSGSGSVFLCLKWKIA